MSRKHAGVVIACVLCAAVAALDASLFVRARAGSAGEREEEGATYGAGARQYRMMKLTDRFGRMPVNAYMRAKAHVDTMKAARRERRMRGEVAPLASSESSAEVGAGAAHPLAASSAASTISPDGWKWLGPGNIGGRIRSLVIDPTNPAIMLAGSVGGGIWKTIDGGKSWAPVDDFMAVLSVSSMAIVPTKPSIIYAGTGEGYSNGDAIRGAGIFKSTDGGDTWRQLASTAGDPGFWAVNRLSVSPNGQVLLAGTGSGTYRSTDGGTSFTLVPTGIPSQDLDFHPFDSMKAIASGWGQLAYSRDSGVSWHLANGLPFGSGRIETAYARSSPDVIYASVDENRGALYRSNDGGANFFVVTPGDLLAGQGWYDNAVWVNPKNRNDVIVGGQTLHHSLDGGATWEDMPGLHVDIHVILEHPGYDDASNRTVFVANDGGLYKTSDVRPSSGAAPAFKPLNNNLGVTQFYGGAGSAATGVIVGGTQDNGTLRYQPTSGTKWTQSLGSDGGYAASDPTDPSYFYGETIYLSLHRSTDGGSTFVPIDMGIADAGQNANFIAPFVLDPNNPNRMLAGGSRLWRSNNVKAASPSWAAIRGSSGSDYISAIAIAPGNSDVVWVGHSYGRVYRATNGTSATPTFKATNAPTAGNFVTRITINPFDSNVVYVTTGSFGTSNIIKTTDGGATWFDATGEGSTGLPDAPVNDLEVDPARPQTIYAATEVGVFASADAGATWELPQDGPANVCVDELFWMGSRLVAATHGRGMFAIETGGGTSQGDSGASSAPAPWAARDIGSVSHSGSTTYADGTFTLAGRGADVWGSADAFHFAYQTLTGDGVIVAHVASVQNVNAWTKAGLMIRGTLEADSVHASIFVTPGKGIALQYRAVTGGESSNVGAPGSAPQWIKLTRAGSVITASASPDGGAWVPVGHATLTLPGTAFVGLVIGSHDDTRTAAAAFDHVSIMPLPSSAAVPALWQAADVGAVGAKGSASEHGGVFAVKGAGADIWDAEDAFQYVYRELAGNGSIVARVAGVQYVDAWTKAGVMIRQSLDPGSAHASLFVTPGKGIAFQRRTAHAGTSTNTGTPGAAPRWVKLTRDGQLLTAFTSVDGAAWTKIDQDTIAISGAVWAGLAVSSHAAGTPAAASFDMVSVSEASSLPASWLDLDIGSVGITGSATYKSDTFTVSASGNDIWNTRDAFHFVYQTLADDGQITARVATIESGHRWTKAAVMIRQTTSAKSAFAMMTVSAAAGSAFQYRSASGALAASIAGSSAAVPQWIKIARVGDTLSGYQSSDGLSWTLVGSATIAMGQSVDIGLAVTSHDNTLACKASFDHVSR